MAKYRIGDKTISPAEANFEQVLQAAKQAGLRPECLCTGDAGVVMYIAQINNRFWLKRMPNSGRMHAVGCASWETPEEFSGRHDLVGSALRYKEKEEVALRLGFSLSHRGKGDGDAMERSNKEKPTAKVAPEDARLTLKSLLHYLWDEAGLTAWTGGDEPRDWPFVHDSLSLAAARKTVKHAELQNYLFIPKPRSRHTQGEIDSDRRKRFGQIAGFDDKKVRHLLLMTGQVKSMKQVGGDWNVLFEEMPGYPFLIKGDLHAQMIKHLGREMRLVSSESPGFLVLVGTFYVEQGGIAVFEEVSLMYVNESWIPYESIYERDLIGALIEQKRSFLRLLRYNRPNASPMPTLLLTDCGDDPVAVYVLDAESSTSSGQMTAAAAASKYESIVWDPKVTGDIPTVPPKTEGGARRSAMDAALLPNPFAPLEPSAAASPAVATV